MNYRTVADLTALLQNNVYRFKDVDIVVGIPRSGMIPASIIATLINKRLASLDEICQGRTFSRGDSRITESDNIDTNVNVGQVILVVDDSVASGKSMEAARKKLFTVSVSNRLIFLAIYGSILKSDPADIVLERVSHPRAFEWNLMHHPILKDACVDIDGVLCRDPSATENDDAENYLEFLETVTPRLNVTQYIGHLVTNRLEKYRAETEVWLAKCNIRYGELHMLNLPSAKKRRELGDYHSHKASIYVKTGSKIFIESDVRQAELIANAAGKSVICTADSKMYQPMVSPRSIVQSSKGLFWRMKVSFRVVAGLIARRL